MNRNCSLPQSGCRAVKIWSQFQTVRPQEASSNLLDADHSSVNGDCFNLTCQSVNPKLNVGVQQTLQITGFTHCHYQTSAGVKDEPCQVCFIRVTQKTCRMMIHEGQSEKHQALSKTEVPYPPWDVKKMTSWNLNIGFILYGRKKKGKKKSGKRRKRTEREAAEILKKLYYIIELVYCY